MPRHRLSDPIELDTMPFAGMMLLLIPMLLASAQFASLATVDASTPAIAVTPGDDPADRLDLTVAIDAHGYRLSAAPSALDALGWTAEGLYVPGAVDDPAGLAALTEQLGLIKDAFPADDSVILAPGDDVPYAHVIAVMDASRQGPAGAILFPGVVFGAVTSGP